MHDFYAFVAAGTVIVVPTGIALLLRFRAKGPTPVDALPAPPRLVEDRGARERERAAKDERERLVLAGKILPDGRPRCQASPTCNDPATRHRPLVLRDDGFLDLVRRGFGAADRQRLGSYEAPWWHALANAVRDVPLPSPVPEFCEEHIHLGWEEGRAELADVEHGRVKGARDDQARLAYFAKAGLMERVAKRIAEVEIAEKRAKRARGPLTTNDMKVVPIRAVGGDK